MTGEFRIYKIKRESKKWIRLWIIYCHFTCQQTDIYSFLYSEYPQLICFIQHQWLDKKDHTIKTGIESAPSNNLLDVLLLNYLIISLATLYLHVEIQNNAKQMVYERSDWIDLSLSFAAQVLVLTLSQNNLSWNSKKELLSTNMKYAGQ